MKTPPEMLSPKDCSYLSDLLETVLTLEKKASCYEQDIQDEDVKKEIHTQARELKKMFNTLLEQVN